MISNVCFSFIMALLLTTGSLHAQTPLHDPNLHTVSPEALRQLSNDRARQKIIEDSLAVGRGRDESRRIEVQMTEFDLVGA
jgi:hypothetical protein